MNVEQVAADCLRRIARAMDCHSKTLLREFRLTGPQLLVLRALASRDAAPVGMVAKAANLGAATVTGVVDRLEREGFVVRVRGGSDRRQILIRMTDEGRALLARGPSILEPGFRRRLMQLSEEEKSQTCRVLEQLVRLMGPTADEQGAIAGDELPTPGNKPSGNNLRT